MTVTPRPWRDAQAMGAIVSDDPDAIKARGPENFKGYGGAIVCESAEKPDRDFIIRAANEYDAHAEIELLARRYGGSTTDEDRWALNAAIARLDAARRTA